MTEIILNKRFHYSSSFNFSTVAILIISLIFALLLGSGFYGYGNDWYAAYHKSNLEWGGPFDRLGYLLSTATINGKHIGVQLVSFILALSAGLLIREHIKFKETYSLVFFTVLYVIAIHTWPIIMCTTNGMRQGLCMSFIFMALVAGSRRNYYWMILLFGIAIFMHKSGLLLAAMVAFSPIVKNFLSNFSDTNKTLFNFLIGMFLFIAAYYVVDIIGFNEKDKPSKIIGLDFRYVFIFIGFIYVALSFFYRSMLSNSFNLTLYYFSFIAPSLLMNDLNWEYERLGMMMLIPYILSFGIVLNKFTYQVYLVSTFVLLLFLTIITGMYASFR